MLQQKSSGIVGEWRGDRGQNDGFLGEKALSRERAGAIRGAVVGGAGFEIYSAWRPALRDVVVARGNVLLIDTTRTCVRKKLVASARMLKIGLLRAR